MAVALEASSMMHKSKTTSSASSSAARPTQVEAITVALGDAGLTLGDMDYRLTDLSGEQYGFKEADLAITRTLREHKEAFDIWHPADSIGEVGAAALPCMLGVALAAAEKGFDPGPSVLCHLGNDDGARAALVSRRGTGGT